MTTNDDGARIITALILQGKKLRDKIGDLPNSVFDEYFNDHDVIAFDEADDAYEEAKRKKIIGT